MKVFIIGGGAAGMMAGIYAAKNGAEVTILERNEKLGKKLYITGKGRCNLTNTADYNEYFNNIISNPKFLSGALRLMPPDSVIKIMNENGLKTKIERGRRVFPVTDKSSDVIKVLIKCLKDYGVKVVCNEKVLDFEIKDKKITKIITEKSEYYPDRVILATGGKSYKATGSDGLGYKLAKKAGHSIVEVRPALAPLLSNKCYTPKGQAIQLKNLPSLQGLSLKNVEARIVNENNKVIYKEFGEMLFTHNGVSGPIILTLSSKINRMDIKKLKLMIDLKPALDFKQLDKRLIRELEEKRNKILKNSLADILPTKLIPFIIRLSEIDEETKVNNITKEQRNILVRLLKELAFDFSLADINEGIVTAGGIFVKEINPKNMQSKLIDNLFFAGEIIDIDALTGGFNLQLAFSTGCAAGTYITQ